MKTGTKLKHLLSDYILEVHMDKTGLIDLFVIRKDDNLTGSFSGHTWSLVVDKAYRGINKIQKINNHGS